MGLPVSPIVATSIWKKKAEPWFPSLELPPAIGLGMWMAQIPFFSTLDWHGVIHATSCASLFYHTSHLQGTELALSADLGVTVGTDYSSFALNPTAKTLRGWNLYKIEYCIKSTFYEYRCSLDPLLQTWCPDMLYTVHEDMREATVQYTVEVKKIFTAAGLHLNSYNLDLQYATNILNTSCQCVYLHVYSYTELHKYV